MIRGLYTAGAGMMLQMARQDVVANNLANVNTSGFKKNTAVAKAFPDMLISRLGECREDRQGELKAQRPVVIGRLGTGASVSGIYTDFDNSNLKKTDSPCDLAITGAGYFVIQTPEGQRFTRCGEFKINSEGILTTNNAYPLLDDNDSPITIEGEFTVNEQGSISVDGEQIARIRIVDFDDLQLMERLGNNLLDSPEEPIEVERPEILQGYIEQSNVNAVKEMVALISVVRAYESLQKMVQAEDEITGQAIDKVGSIN